MEGNISRRHQHRGQETNGKAHQSNTKQLTSPKKHFTWGQCLKYEVDLSGKFILKHADLPKSCTDLTAEASPIQQFFADSHVLVTGGTGFLGKMLVEKLLVSCPRLSKIYLLVREKKGQSMEERFDNLFKDEVFGRLHATVPDWRTRVVGIRGDCSELGLGLSQSDKELLAKNVSIIIHGAATVRFNDHIRNATHINIRGVLEMIKLARTCSQLKSFVHISTAFANATTDTVDIAERFYSPAYDYKALMQLVDTETEENLSNMTDMIISPWPNTYAFTKQVAEDVVRREAASLPFTVFRPAIVIATYKEPVRGWCDNIYGPTGIAAGIGTGVLRVVRTNVDCKANMVPGDFTVNAIIAAAWKVAQAKQEKTPVIYNYVSTTRNPVTWGEFTYWNDAYGRPFATMKAIWHPLYILVQNKLLFTVLSFLMHTIPAYIADSILLVLGQERMLVKAYQKINKFCKVLEYFSMKEWGFPDRNVKELWEGLSTLDQAIFPFNISDLDWDYFCQGHLLGLRTYLVKDPLDTLPQARIKYKRLAIQHYALTGFVIFFCLWILSKLVGWSFF